MGVPKYDDLFNPLLVALHRLGGSASVGELEDEVGALLKLSEKEVNAVHRGNRTQLGYRLAWARNYLKRAGFLENSSRGVWALTPKGFKTLSVDKKEINKYVKQLDRESTTIEEEVERGENPTREPSLWQDKLLDQLYVLSPAAFEKLCQRILRESGFIQVEVTGRSGDGGIDGKGILRIGGFLTFRVVFQCKRYRGSVATKQIRDFRGAMIGRADKGLFMTTGTFTRDAKEEAVRDGAPPIDLIDGDLIVERMKELKLGVTLKTEEHVEVDTAWFDQLD